MKKILLSFCFLVLAILANAQTPTFHWAKSFGGSTTFDDVGYAIAVDDNGNVYITGKFIGTADFDPGPSVYTLTSVSGNYDIFVSKFDALGNFVWAKNMGGNSSDIGNAIAVDSTGNVYITGRFSGTGDFDPGVGVFNLTVAGGGSTEVDLFISKLNSLGDFVWAKHIGGTTSYDEGTSIELDNNGNVVIAGYFNGTVDFDPGAGVFNLFGGTDYGFVLKLNSVGDFLLAKNFVGQSLLHSMAIDKNNNILLAGEFKGTTDFDPSLGTTFYLSADSTSTYDIYIVKLDSVGNFSWAKRMGGSLNDVANSLEVDVSGNVYLTGSFKGTADFDPGVSSFNLISYGAADIFVSKLDSLGNFLWAKKIGAATDDVAYSVALDSNSVYTTGSYGGTVDFDPGLGIFNLVSSGSRNIFISKLDSLGNFVWAKTSVSCYGFGYSIEVDQNGNIYTTGVYIGTGDFNPDAGIYNLTSNVGGDVFVQKLGDSLLITQITKNIISNIITLYPNPTNGSLYVFTSQQIKNGSIEIYNTIGELIFAQKIINQQNTIDIKNQASGLYFVKVISDGEVIGMKKVVKE